MANTHAFLLWGAGAALANNQFNSLNGSSQYQNTTESWYQTVLGKGVTFTKFAVYWHVILAGGGNLNFRKNGANGNQTLVGGVADGIVQDVTHTDATSAGDLVAALAANTLQLYAPSWLCSPHARATPFTNIGAGPSGNTSGLPFTNGTYYTNLVGDCSNGQASSSVTNLQEVQQAGTAASYAVNVQSAPAGNVTMNYQVNSALGNQSLAFTGVTGVVEDTTHTDAIAANSQLNQKVTSTANSGTFQHVAFDFNGNKSTLPYVASFNPRQGGGPAAYLAPGGAILINVATIALANVPVTVGFTASQLLFSSDTSQNVSNQFIQLYNNSVAGNMKVIYPANTTGFYNDATHTDAISTGNPFCNFYTGGGFDVSMVGFGLDDLSNSGATPRSFASVQ